jgi:cation diffusion facilitator CzcD-associated flavoprotein CzcO
MLQRSPTYMVSRPGSDAIAEWLKRKLPLRAAYWLTRWKNVLLQMYFFRLARGKPERTKAQLIELARRQLPPGYDVETHFTPRYNPWDQRLCLVPDNDFFEALKSGKASIVTGHIDTFEQGGIRLRDGRTVPANVVVTATGLRLALGGKIAVSLDGRPVAWNQHRLYRGCMFSNVPNLAVVFGYLNASWTLRADNNADYVCRVLNRMADKRAEMVSPYLPENHDLVEDDIILYSSGYLQRAKALMPKSTAALPWRLNQDYLEDCRDFRKRPIDDGILRFEKRPAQSKAA